MRARFPDAQNSELRAVLNYRKALVEFERVQSTTLQNSNITINFTEPVNATAGSFSVQCPAGSPQTFTLSSSPSASFTLDPTADLPAGTTCTVTVFAAGITDADNFDPPEKFLGVSLVDDDTYRGTRSWPRFAAIAAEARELLQRNGVA